jgi:hypothetical protein
MLQWLEKHMLPCGFKAIFNIDCPVCGAQRSFVQLLKGNLAESFSVYPPLIPVLLLVTLGIWKLLNKQFIQTNFLKSYSLVVLIIVMFNYIIRFIR